MEDKLLSSSFQKKESESKILKEILMLEIK
jgi:hypothetical protein